MTTTNGLVPETKEPKISHKEEPYDLILVVKIAGHGSSEHKRKQAAFLKRILEVKTHSKPDVLLVEQHGEHVLTLTCTEVTWEAQEGFIE